MIALITCFFNPTQSRTLRSNYLQFRKHLKHPIVTVEVAYDQQPFFIEDAIQLRASANQILWQKERLLNIALESLPDKVTKVAWLDADIIFENENWLREAEEKLDSKPVVQLFESVYEVENGGGIINRGESSGKLIEQSNNPATINQLDGHRGICWSARREVLEDGFFDLGIIGGGDTYHFLACINDWSHSAISWMTPKMRKEYLLWAWNLGEKVKGNIGFVSGKVRHLHHGSFKDRQYFNRHKILVKNNFCPDTDIFKDSNQLWSLSGNKPELQEDLKQYFHGRKENE